MAAAIARSAPFGDREGLALFASAAVDLGFVFLTLVLADRPARRRSGRRGPPPAQGLGLPEPPRMGGIVKDGAGQVSPEVKLFHVKRGLVNILKEIACLSVSRETFGLPAGLSTT